VLLEPLDPLDSELLLEQLGGGLDPDATLRVIAASEGNPLFLEEMVALARERGTVAVPSTIQALLTARLERLDADDREVLERGAVEGEVFHRLAVRALTGERVAAEVELRLGGLVRKELIRPHPPTLRDDEAFRFRHLLIRDAAYDGLPKATRADLHERLGDRSAAEAAVELSDRLSADEDAINPTITHRVRARLALADGDVEAAERWARSALEKAFQTEFVVEQGEAKLDLARVLVASGRIEDARSEAREASERFTAKGDLPGDRTAQALLEELAEC